MRKLNLGCGKDYKKGWTNVDVIGVKKDVKHNLNKVPYPFRKNTFDEILMKMVLEHLDDPIKVLKEIVRISANNAKLTIIVPHATSYANFTDIQHRTNFKENSFNKDLLEEYELRELKLKKIEFLYRNKWKKFIPFKNILKIFYNGVYDDILFEFKIKKDG
jgi:ubiquinone/menaquinone biosynthesis C-methylase UbiE